MDQKHKKNTLNLTGKSTKIINKITRIKTSNLLIR